MSRCKQWWSTWRISTSSGTPRCSNTRDTNKQQVQELSKARGGKLSRLHLLIMSSRTCIFELPCMGSPTHAPGAKLRNKVATCPFINSHSLKFSRTHTHKTLTWKCDWILCAGAREGYKRYNLLWTENGPWAGRQCDQTELRPIPQHTFCTTFEVSYKSRDLHVARRARRQRNMSYMYEQQLAHAANSRCMYVDLRLIALTSQWSRLIWLISEPQARPARATSVKSSAAWPGCQLKASSKGQWMTYDHMDDKHLRWQTSDFTACMTQNWADGKTIAQALQSSSSGNVCEGRPRCMPLSSLSPRRAAITSLSSACDCLNATIESKSLQIVQICAMFCRGDDEHGCCSQFPLLQLGMAHQSLIGVAASV